MPRKGSTTNRGYGAAHQRERAKWAPRVKAGGINCRRCHNPIQPNQPWDLGHVDGTINTSRPLWSGPEHQACNRRAGQQQGQKGRGRGAGPRPAALSFFDPAADPPTALGA